MSSLWIGIILFGSILGTTIIIVLILALFQQHKIKQFKQKRNELQTAINENLLFLNSSLAEITITYELPKNEKCYYQAKINGYEIIKKKEINQNIYYLKQPINLQYHIENLVGYLNLTTATGIETISGEIYVTNYRLVITTKQQNLVIWLRDVNFALPSIFNLNGLYQSGFFISTNEKIYRFITNDVKISMTIFKVWQQQKGI
ncbi:hypothetical protein [Spiroplasma sp. SV19]|uniref:hypothetical protein n=1 Tax=Spiroplasma sp. SV19 TaxID=2570468 RepID=UPI0024B6EAE0|nr:hypothetical protein [Spiroplasma sp. SV19]WHQ36597.1 hypothetical protein E7Y35_01470 [Spiroplasma sp. SV19]